jgi:mRNA interferase MazF
MVKRFEVYWVNLDPTIGSEIKKQRPCVIISPDEMNQFLQTVIVAPLTSTLRKYPSRVSLTFHKKKGQVVLDQIRSIDKSRLLNKLGELGAKTQLEISNTLLEIFTL